MYENLEFILQILKINIIFQNILQNFKKKKYFISQSLKIISLILNNIIYYFFNKQKIKQKI